MEKDPSEIMCEEMQKCWDFEQGGIHHCLTIEAIWQRGFESGYRSGIDRGMEIEHDLLEDLKQSLGSEYGR